MQETVLVTCFETPFSVLRFDQRPHAGLSSPTFRALRPLLLGVAFSHFVYVPTCILSFGVVSLVCLAPSHFRSPIEMLVHRTHAPPISISHCYRELHHSVSYSRNRRLSVKRSPTGGAGLSVLRSTLLMVYGASFTFPLARCLLVLRHSP